MAELHIPDDLIEIHDPEIDPKQIMAQIRERIEQRRKESGYERRTFPIFGAVAYPGEPEDIPYDSTLYYYLRLVNGSYAQFESRANLAPSPATSIPILGRLWQLIREQAHLLVLFYVNRAVAHQTHVNRQLISVLNRLMVVNQAQQREIAALRAELQHTTNADRQ